MNSEVTTSVTPADSNQFSLTGVGSPIDLLNEYAHIFVAAFLIALIVTPIAQRLGELFGVVDRPDNHRKEHSRPVAYLGGIAVLAGILVAVGISYVTGYTAPITYMPVPIAVVIGMVAIALAGLADDVWGWDPRLKIAGQLVAAAALAIQDVGVRVADGILTPVFGSENLLWSFNTPLGMVELDIVYWVGTLIIAVFVLGGCNAANLMDGLDGLVSGIVAVIAIGLLAISLLMLPTNGAEILAGDSGTLAGARVVLCLALLGAVLGFLPFNFNPASIFLGDSGSMLLGYMCVVIILMFGEHGQTHLVFAGLIVFALPIIDTMLAIIRRRLAGRPLSAGDNQHLHHQLRRVLGGTRRAVVSLYGISLLFAILGVSLAALVIKTDLRIRVIYAIVLVLFGLVVATGMKAARRGRNIADAPAIETQPQTKVSSESPVETCSKEQPGTSHSPAK